MSYSFAVHHIFPREVMELFSDNIDALFGGAANNPFHLDANSNKILLASDPIFASALADLTQAGSNPFGDIGVGDAAHVGFHDGLNIFLESQFKTIFDGSRNLSPDQQKAALFDLFRYAKQLAVSGQPPLSTSTLTELAADWSQTKVPDADLLTDTSLQTALDDFTQAELDPANLDRFSDLDDPVNNYEFRKAVAIDLLQKALDSGSIHDNLKPIYEARIDALENNTFKADTHSGTISKWLGEAASEITYHKGVADSTFILPNLDPNSIADQAPKSPAPDALARFEAELGISKNLSDAISRLDGIGPPSSGSTTPVGSIDPEGLTNKFSPVFDHFVRLSDSFSPDGAGVLTQADLGNMVGDFLRSVDGALSKLQGATTLADFGRISEGIVDAFRYFHGGIADAMASVRFGPLLAFAGSIGDIAELGIAAGRAYDLAAAGDWTGAAETMLNATSNLAISSAASILGGVAAVAFGATGAPVVIAMLVAGVAAGFVWDKYIQEHVGWLDDLLAQWNPRAIDPLVIDLDGDGLELTALGDSDARFDLDGDGFAELTAWVAPDDGLLAIDRNGNGQIDDISELFGSPTETGYEELAAFDTNGNGVVSAQDADFNQLLVWRDLDGDGVTDAGELQTLSEAGITSISVNPSSSTLNVNGNSVIETATVTMADGTTTQSGEVLFNLSQVESSYIMPDGFTYDNEVFSLPTLRGFGEIADLWVAMSEDVTLKQDAQNLIATARTGDFASFKGDFDAFLANWADVEDAVWWQESGLEIDFAYDRDHLTDFYTWKVNHPDVVIDGVTYPGSPYPGPTPGAKAFYFGPGGATGNGSPEFTAWLDDNDLEIAYFLETDPGFWGFVVTTYQSPGVTVVGSSNGRTYQLAEFGGQSDAPDMDAAAFAFLEKLMGQDYRVGVNYFAPENVIVTTPEDDQVDDLQTSYDEVKDYAMARFLAQAAWSIIDQEGDTADLGALAPFQHIFYNPFEDKVVGDIQALASDLITDFRNNPQATDADALDLLRLFVPDFKYVGAYVAAEFPDMDRTLLSSVLETGQLLEGTSSSETLSLAQAGTAIGYDGNDSLTGSSGSDVLMGGAGNDTMAGGAGDDFYLIDKNEGSDRIIEAGGSDDTIRFASGIALADLLAVPTNSDGDSHDDLTFSFANGTGSFTIEDMLSQGPSWNTNIHNASQIEWFEFADGTRLSRADFLRLTYFAGTAGADDIRGTYFDDTISGGAGNDTLKGGAGSDLYLIDKDQGDKLIVEGGGTDDTIRFATGIALADLLAVATNVDGDSHDDLTFSFANGTGSFTIEDMLSQGPSWATNIQDSSQIEWFEFADGTRLSRADFLTLTYFAGTAGADDIRGTFYDDTISGGAGNDTLRGGEGNDTYQVDLGQGDKRIIEGGGSNDTIKFAAGIALAYILGAATNADGDAHYDLTFSFANGTGSFTIEDMLSQGPTWNTNIHITSQIEWFEFDDGTRLNRADFLTLTYFAGTTGADDIRGTIYDDTISGGAGNDTLRGGDGNDTYLIDKGQGDKIIVEGGGSNDTIRFAAGLALADILAVASNADGDSHYDLTFSFANGTGSFTIEDMLSQGPSWATNIQSASQIEWFEFDDGTRLSRADFLRLAYYSGTSGADDIRGTFYDDTISGGTGNDTLRGGEGNDTYQVDLGQGDKRIIEGGGSNDTIRFAAGITLADIVAAPTNADGDTHSDLTFSFVNGTGSVTIEDMLSQGPSWATNIQSTSQIEWFEFDDGTRLNRADFLRQTYFAGTSGDDNIQGTFFDDTMTGGLGNDTLSGLSGNDTYLIDLGQGDDRILEGYNYSNDRMIFAAGITLADLQASLTDTDGSGIKDLTISFANGAGSVTLEEVFRTDSWAHDRQVDWFEFSDGTVLSHEQLFTAIYHNGTSGDDHLLGTTSNDTFTGSLGNDTMEGQIGNDTYLVDVDQGDDFILEGWNYTNDRIIFAAGIDANDVVFSRTDVDGDGYDDLHISFANNSGSVTILEAFRPVSWVHDRQVDWFEFSDGTVINHDDLILV